ncbi:GIY-YIG nuclease family protein [Mucilaginibacter sp. dw_454]|uniref:GIY-YIG nuclease family protein n=1 Tax=Mucilaginibacter sp. dw_454 TaxID=2720079 RepID=UPI002106FDD4|nr:GIY-YIG nuclease family protein [Mucilaginibacter sp. dw_454]
MVFQRGGCVYIMTNKMHSVLYVGVSSELPARVYNHKTKQPPKALPPSTTATSWSITFSTRTSKKPLPPKNYSKAVAANTNND